MKLSLLVLLLLGFMGSVSALGHISSHSHCTPKDGVMLYLDRWEKRDCVGLSLPVGTTTFSPAQEAIYGHTITVPEGYNVVIHKAPLFKAERVTNYGPGSRFVSYFWLDTPITSVTVTTTALNTITKK